MKYFDHNIASYKNIIARNNNYFVKNCNKKKMVD